MKKIIRMAVFVLLVMLVSACTFAQNYEVYVEGVQITDENAADVLADGTVSYDALTNTLTLNEAVLSASFQVNPESQASVQTAVIYTKQELNVVVNGYCSVMSDAVSSYDDYCIYMNVPAVDEGEKRPALTITGGNDEAHLRVNSADTGNTTSAIYTYNADIVIEDIKLECYSATGVQSNTVCSSGGIISIDNSEVTCQANTAQTQTACLLSGRGVFISGASNVSLLGKNCNCYIDNEVSTFGVITLGTLVISEESTLDATAGQISGMNDGSSCGVFALSGIELYGNSKLNASAGYVSSSDSSAECISMGVFSSNITVDGDSEIVGSGSYGRSRSAGVYGQTITIIDGSVSGSSAEGLTVSAGIASDNPIQGEGADVCEGETKYYLEYVPASDGLPGYYVDANGEVPKKTIAASCVEFDLWVGSVRVTSDNMNDVLGDGKVRYDHKTGVLTLDNATITDTHIYLSNTYSQTDENGVVTEVTESSSAGLYTNMPITVEIIGDVVIDCSDDTSLENHGICFDHAYAYDDYTFTILGDGESSLTVRSGGEEISHGIYTDDGICQIKDLNLDVKAGDTAETSVGLFFQDADDDLWIEIDNCDATISGGNLSDKSGEFGSAGIAGGYMYVKNGSNVTASAGDVSQANGSLACSGVLCIGYVEITDESTLNAYGGDVYASSGEIKSIGMYVVGKMTVGDGCSVTAIAGGAYYDGEATMDNAQSIGYGNTLVETIIGDNATLTAVGGYSDGASAGVYIEDVQTTPEYDETIVLTTENSTLVAGTTNTNTDAINVGIYTDNPIQNATVRDEENRQVLTYNGGVYFDKDGNMVSNTIVNGGVILFGDYNLIVGGIQVTELNKDDILGELDGDRASAYYDPDTKTLTLDNADITAYYDMDGGYVGILRAGLLNINLVGSNKVTVNSYTEMPEMVAGVAAFDDLKISGQDSARLEIVTGDAKSGSYGIYTNVMDGGEFTSDVTICKRANVIARSGKIHYEYECYTAGVYAYGSLNVLDGASLYGYSDEAVFTSTSSSSAFGISAGILSYNVMNINTTGTVYGYGKKSDFVFGGLGGFSGLNLQNGVVIGECGNDAPANAVSAGVVFKSEPQNVIVRTGASADSLGEEYTWYVLSADVGGTYLDGTSAPGKYTELLPMKGICGLETENGSENEDNVVIKSIDAEGEVFVAFASYDENGRMIDYKTTFAANTDEENEISVSLNLDGAVKVKAFVFENNTSFNPVCDYIEKVYFDTAA